MLTSAESIRGVKIGGSLGCSDHALVELVILGNARLAKSRVRTLNFRKANFQLIKELLGGISWENVFEGLKQNRASSSLRTPKSSPSPSRRRNGAEEEGDWHG